MCSEIWNVARRADRLEFAAVLRTGLEVPDVDRGGPAAQPQQDARLLVLPHRGRVGLEVQQEIKCGHSGRGWRTGVIQKMPARHAGGDVEVHGSRSAN